MNHSAKVRTSSSSNEWGTPQKLFDFLDRFFHFDVDLAAAPGLNKCQRFFSPEDSAINKKWDGVCWCNPPYGKKKNGFVGTEDFLRKGAQEIRENPACDTIVFLTYNRTDCKWFQKAAKNDAHCIIFIEGRLTFENPALEIKSPATAGSVLMVYTKSKKQYNERFFRRMFQEYKVEFGRGMGFIFFC